MKTILNTLVSEKRRISFNEITFIYDKEIVSEAASLFPRIEEIAVIRQGILSFLWKEGYYVQEMRLT